MDHCLLGERFSRVWSGKVLGGKDVAWGLLSSSRRCTLLLSFVVAGTGRVVYDAFVLAVRRTRVNMRCFGVGGGRGGDSGAFPGSDCRRTLQDHRLDMSYPVSPYSIVNPIGCALLE